MRLTMVCIEADYGMRSEPYGLIVTYLVGFSRWFFGGGRDGWRGESMPMQLRDMGMADG